MSETVVNFPRAAALRFPGLVPLARNALIRSFPTLKFLYRAGAVLWAWAFGGVWLWFLGGDRNFPTLATHCVADLRALGLMSSIAFIHAFNFVARMLSAWPPAAGILTAVLLTSFLVYGAIQIAKGA